MKKNVIALLMAVIMASSSIRAVPALAVETAVTETTAEEAVAVEEEILDKQEEVSELSEDSDFRLADEDVLEEEYAQLEEDSVQEDEKTEEEAILTDEQEENVDIDLAKAKIELPSYAYQVTGKEIKPRAIVTYNGETLKQDTDYTLSYKNNIKAGITAKVIVHGIGKYHGTVSIAFLILPGKTTRGDMFNLANSVKIKWNEVYGARYYKVYREGITNPYESSIKPVFVTRTIEGWDNSSELVNGHAYRYKIVASLTGADDSSGDSKVSYSKVMYRLQTVVIRSVKNTAPGKVTIKYDMTESGDSYVIKYSDRSDMQDARTKVVLGKGNTSCTIGGLKKGKTYYFAIRVRKKVNGIDYYTTFGVCKKIKITQ